MRIILGFMAIIGLGLLGFSYYGDALSLSTLAQIPLKGHPGSPPALNDSQADLLMYNLKEIYRLWGLIRYAGIFIFVLAILGFRRSGKPGDG